MRSSLLLMILLSGCGAKYVRPVGNEKIEATRERIIRGGYLVNQVCACGACHTSREHGNVAAEPELTAAFLGGGNLMSAAGVADDVWVPNLTPDAETGVGAWSDDELLRALRDGVARDGRFLLPLMPFADYQHLSDEDARAIVAYLRTVPPYRQTKPRPAPKLGLVARVLYGKVGVQMHLPVHDVPPPDPDDQAKQGEYVARIAACASCHALTTKGRRKPEDPHYLAGSEGPFEDRTFGKVWARNLTPDKETGIGKAFPDQIKKALRTGKRLDGKRMAPPMAALVPHLAGVAEEDLDALVVYLRKALKPVRHEVPERELGAAIKAAYGD